MPTIQNFLTVLPGERLDNLIILRNTISPRILEYIEHCTTYEEAISRLKAQYVKPATALPQSTTPEDALDSTLAATGGAKCYLALSK